MSTILTTRPISCHSNHITAGRQSFFFDVKRIPDGPLFMSICELTVNNNVWTRQTVMVPGEQIREFYAGMCEAIRALRAEAAEHGIVLSAPTEPSSQIAAPPRTKATATQARSRSSISSRATGREASRAAVVA